MSNINTSDIAAMVDEILVEGGDDGFDIGTDEMNLITDYPSKNEIEDLLDEFHKYVGADEEELSIGKNDIIALESPNDDSDLEIEPPILLEDSDNEESQDSEEIEDNEEIERPISIEKPEIEAPEKQEIEKSEKQEIEKSEKQEIEKSEKQEIKDLDESIMDFNPIFIEDTGESIIGKIIEKKTEEIEEPDDSIMDFNPIFIEDTKESIIGNSEITDEKRYEKINKLTEQINEIFDDFEN